MPPEQDENRDRQLAALRRYVSDLDVRRQGNGGQTREREGRRRVAWPWLLVTLLLMAVSLGGGIAIGPVLLGAARPVHILTPSATVRRIVNMTALTMADANAART